MENKCKVCYKEFQENEGKVFENNIFPCLLCEKCWNWAENTVKYLSKQPELIEKLEKQVEES